MRSERFWSFQKPGSDVWDSFVSILERIVAASKTPPDLKYFFFELRYRRSQFFKHRGLPLRTFYALFGAFLGVLTVGFSDGIVSEGERTTTRFQRFSLSMEIASRPSTGYW